MQTRQTTQRKRQAEEQLTQQASAAAARSAKRVKVEAKRHSNKSTGPIRRKKSATPASVTNNTIQGKATVVVKHAAQVHVLGNCPLVCIIFSFCDWTERSRFRVGSPTLNEWAALPQSFFTKVRSPIIAGALSQAVNRKLLTECLTTRTRSLDLRNKWPDHDWLLLHKRCPELRSLDLRSTGPLDRRQGFDSFSSLAVPWRSLDMLCASSASGGTLTRLDLPHFPAYGGGIQQDIHELARRLPRDTCLQHLGASLIPDCTGVMDSVEWLAPLLRSLTVYPRDHDSFYGGRMPMDLYEQMCKRTAKMLSKTVALEELHLLFRSPCDTCTGDMVYEILSTASLPKLKRLKVVTSVLSQSSVDLMDKLNLQSRKPRCRVSWNGHKWRGKWHRNVLAQRADPYVLIHKASVAKCWGEEEGSGWDEFSESE
jgi:hypothetical protein